MKNIKYIILLLLSLFINIYNVSAERTINEGTYIISSLLNQNKNIDVSNGNTDNGTNIQIWENNNSNAQKWIIEYNQNGYYTFKSKLNTNKCLQAKEEKITNSTNIQLFDCNNSDNQQFTIKHLGNGYFSIITKKDSSMYLDVDGAKTNNGTNIQLWENNGNNAQKWKFTEIIDLKQTIYNNTYIISSALDNNKNLDVDGAKTNNGTNVQLWENNGNNAQKWKIIYLKNGYYNIKSKLNTNKCLEIKNANYSIYANIQISDCNNSDKQQFIIKKIDNEYYSIISKINRLYIDADGAKTNNGTNIQLYYNNNNNAQKWRFNLVTETKKTINNGTYTIYSMLDENKTLDVSGAKTDNGTNIQLWENNGNNAQKWEIEYLNNGYYKFISKLDSSKCLDIKNNEYYNTTNIQLYDCNNSESQQFSIKDLNNGYFTISAKYNNTNIDISEAKTTNGTNIQLWENNGNNAQKWKFVELLNSEQVINNGIYILNSALDNNKNLDVDGAKTNNGTNIQIWENNGNKAQKWKIEYINGYYQFKSKLNTRKCLEIKNGNEKIYSNIQLSDCNNSDKQQFIIKQLDNNYYSIVSKNNHLYIDVDGAKTNNGTNVQLYYNNDNDAQKWSFSYIDEKEIENGIYTIATDLNNNQMVDVDNAKSFENTNVQLWQNNGNNAQKWYIQKQSDKSYLIRSALNSSMYLSYINNNVIISNIQTKWNIEQAENNKYYLNVKDKNLYLNIENTNASNRTNINLAEESQSKSQLFIINDTELDNNSNTISTSYYTIETKLKSKQNLDADGASKLNGTNIQLWQDNNNKAQIWYIKYINNGEFQILSSMNPYLTFNINGSNIDIWKNTNKNTQKWKLIDDTNGYVYIKSISSNTCLTVNNSEATNGTNIIASTCNNSNNQKFKLNRNTNKKIYKGVDISQYQKGINWETFSKNIDFVILRAGYGDNWSSQDDKLFLENVEKCNTYNIPYGVYLYSYAKKVQKDNNDGNLNYNAESAVSEAAHVKRLLNSVSYKPNLKTSVYLDIEEEKLAYLGKNLQTDIANRFCSIIESSGYGCSIYANLNWLKNHININNLTTKDRIWVANWFSPSPNDYSKALTSAPNYNLSNYKLWQFSDDGRINGYNYAIDLDLGYDIFD